MRRRAKPLPFHPILEDLISNYPLARFLQAEASKPLCPEDEALEAELAKQAPWACLFWMVAPFSIGAALFALLATAPAKSQQFPAPVNPYQEDYVEVWEGDDLKSLASRNRVSIQELLRLNPQLRGAELVPGSVVQVVSRPDPDHGLCNLPHWKFQEAWRKSPDRRGSCLQFLTAPPATYYTRGPRGGCYTLTRGGNRRYVERYLCR